MRYLPPVLLALALACLAFGYWGLETPGGRRAYDEMAGMIPLAVGAIGVLLVIVASGIGLWVRIRTPKEGR